MKVLWTTVIAITLTGTPAAAQHVGQVGIIFQSPVAVGFIWAPSERAAIRPEATFSTLNAGATSSDTWTVAISTPFYLSGRDNVRPYVSPRVSYSRSTSSFSSPIPIPSSASSSTTSWDGAGSFGVQYSPSTRIDIYGETGIVYASNTSSNGGNSHTWGPRSALGLILYLGK